MQTQNAFQHFKLLSAGAVSPAWCYYTICQPCCATFCFRPGCDPFWSEGEGEGEGLVYCVSRRLPPAPSPEDRVK